MFTLDNTECSTKITVISSNQYEIWLKKQSQYLKNWCLSSNFKGQSKKIILVPYDDGKLQEVLIGEGHNSDLSVHTQQHMQNTTIVVKKTLSI